MGWEMPKAFGNMEAPLVANGGVLAWTKYKKDTWRRWRYGEEKRMPGVGGDTGGKKDPWRRCSYGELSLAVGGEESMDGKLGFLVVQRSDKRILSAQRQNPRIITLSVCK